ncbi:hypothetical protein JZ751_022015, partial [Albula glossodonta]
MWKVRPERGSSFSSKDGTLVRICSSPAAAVNAQVDFFDLRRTRGDTISTTSANSTLSPSHKAFGLLELKMRVTTAPKAPAHQELGVRQQRKNSQEALDRKFVVSLLNVGEAEKPADPVAKKPEAEAGTCSCSKPCNCSKTNIGFSELYSTDLLPATNGDLKTMTFLQEVVDILLAYIVESFDRSTKVIDFHYPNELLQSNNWELSDEPETLDDILISCRATLKYAIKTAHPRYFNQLSTGLDMVGLAADWLTSTANTNIVHVKNGLVTPHPGCRFTYEVAPVFVLLEYVTLKKMREIIGWPEGRGDGIFSPGGAISNMYAMLLARFKMFPEVKEKGMSSVPRLAAFTSEHSHFSIKKGAAALGIGTDSVICIKVDERGKMIPSDLERRIVEAKQKGLVPFFVSATAGTTVYGAFDPLIAIADICKKYEIWMHVDEGTCCGGEMALTEWSKANSVTWNPHKMMSVPLQCSALLVREEGLMQSCNQMHACYLFQQDKHYDLSYDTGDKALQCGRHVDIFKLWLMWKAKVGTVQWHGTIGFEAQIDKCLELSEYLYNKIKDREGYEMVFNGKAGGKSWCLREQSPTAGGKSWCLSEQPAKWACAPAGQDPGAAVCEISAPGYTSVRHTTYPANFCSWDLASPPPLQQTRGLKIVSHALPVTQAPNMEAGWGPWSSSHSPPVTAVTPLITTVAPVIKARMMEYGTTMVSYQPQGDKVNFFRMVISNPAATFEDIDFLIEEIE